MGTLNGMKSLANAALEGGTGVKLIPGSGDAEWKPDYNLTDIAGGIFDTLKSTPTGLGTTIQNAPIAQLGSLNKTVQGGVPLQSLDASKLGKVNTTAPTNTAQANYDTNKAFYSGTPGIANTSNDIAGLALNMNQDNALTNAVSLGATRGGAAIPPDLARLAAGPDSPAKRSAQAIIDKLNAGAPTQSTRVSDVNQDYNPALMNALAANAAKAPTQKIADLTVANPNQVADVNKSMYGYQASAAANEAQAAQGITNAQNIGKSADFKGASAKADTAANLANSAGITSAQNMANSASGITSDTTYQAANTALQGLLGTPTGQGTDALRNTTLQNAAALPGSGIDQNLIDQSYQYATRDMGTEQDIQNKRLQTYYNSIGLGGSSAERQGFGNIQREDTRAREGVRSALAIDAATKASENARANVAAQSGVYGQIAGMDSGNALNAANSATNLLGMNYGTQVQAANAGANIVGTQAQAVLGGAGVQADLAGTNAGAQVGSANAATGLAGEKTNTMLGVGNLTNQATSDVANRGMTAQAANQQADIYGSNLEYQRQQDLVKNMQTNAQTSNERALGAASQNLNVGAQEQAATLANRTLMANMTEAGTTAELNKNIAQESALANRQQIGVQSAAAATSAAVDILGATNTAQQQQFNQALQSAQFENEAYQQGVSNEAMLLGQSQNVLGNTLNQAMTIDQAIRNQMANTNEQMAGRAAVRSTGLQDLGQAVTVAANAIGAVRKPN